ncbi:MAG: HlyD family efflux transporter periplasmic adaptor subunit [Opitutaceae bacterium]|nr:HlyD family efflux transporter periplasmic adaptor subunit [Opitutaceae bacterium]
MRNILGNNTKAGAGAMAVLLFLGALPPSGCAKRDTGAWQGYLEAEFVQVGAPLPGRLETLSVAKGRRVEAGAALFALESVAERAALEEARGALRSAEARLADLGKGARPSEIAAIESQLAEAKARADMAALDLSRQQQLLAATVISQDDYDRSRHASAAAAAAVAQIEANLATARLGGRADALAAARAEAVSARAAVDRAQWNASQMAQTAPRAGLVFDTLYREGEYVPAGRPVVVLLPPEFLKARFFVPEPALAALKPGAAVRVHMDGQAAPLEARVSHVSPSPEYTPPVLYNRENRAKLVFMVEAVFSGEAARDLHPGQPVDVRPAE